MASDDEFATFLKLKHPSHDLDEFIKGLPDLVVDRLYMVENEPVPIKRAWLRDHFHRTIYLEDALKVTYRHLKKYYEPTVP